MILPVPFFRKWLQRLAVVLAAGLVCLPSPGWTEKTRIYTYDILKVEGHRPLKLVIEPQGGYDLITYYNEFGDRELSAFDPTGRILWAQYYDSAGVQTAHVDYDYDLKKISLVGIHDATYSLATKAYENNGSLFHLFSFYHPGPGQDIIFSLTQGNLSHIKSEFQRLLICKLVGPIEMFLRYVGNETLEIGDKKIPADHYELGIHDRLLSPFWPTVYHFWYRVEEPRIMVKYQGMNPKQEVETITLVEYLEQEAATPTPAPTSTPQPAATP